VDEDTEEFDYVVVGGGTAGCVLAARLSEDSAVTVLLIEAGSRQPLPQVDIPPAWPTLLGTSADWAGKTVPQPELGGAEILWSRGRGLGGSSTINAMNFMRGHRSSYDWGVKGWGYDDLLPYFKKSENLTGTADRDPAVRGMHGPLRVGPATQRHPLSTVFLDAAAELGFRHAPDLSAGVTDGFGWGDLSIDHGHRSDAATAYLRPVMNRPHLTVVTDALAEQLTFDRDRCTGVTYREHGTARTARATREVVVASGTVGSPQLLMLSGIGPADHLREMDIPVLADLPAVGSNLHDHPMCGIVYTSAQPVPPGANNHGETQGLLLDPDIQLMMIDVPYRQPGLPGPDIGHGYTINAAPMRPRSRGTIRLASTAPGDTPRIDPRFYSNPDDLDVMVKGLRVARKIGNATALAPWRAAETLPGPDVSSDNDMKAYARRNLEPFHHFVGTCAIGDVVDEDLRVHGIQALRVIDASVMPAIVSGNTNATVYAIVERGAALITGS
jgi:choline dehydrogenase